MIALTEDGIIAGNEPLIVILVVILFVSLILMSIIDSKDQ